MSILFCVVTECDRRVHAKQMCNAHYGQKLRGEEFRALRLRKSAGEDFKLCSFAGCKNRKVFRDGLCGSHGWQLKHGKELSALRKPGGIKGPIDECRIIGCDRDFSAKGLCKSHYAIERKYKISAECYEQMMSDCNNLCAICNKECKSGNRLAVDHNHDTGKVRGLLCKFCNTALGGFMDSRENLTKALNYLEKHI